MGCSFASKISFNMPIPTAFVAVESKRRKGGEWGDSKGGRHEGLLETCVPYLISNASLAVDLEIGLHNAITFFVNLVCGTFVTPAAAHIHATSVSSGVQAALPKEKQVHLTNTYLQTFNERKVYYGSCHRGKMKISSGGDASNRRSMKMNYLFVSVSFS